MFSFLPNFNALAITEAMTGSGLLPELWDVVESYIEQNETVATNILSNTASLPLESEHPLLSRIMRSMRTLQSIQITTIPAEGACRRLSQLVPRLTRLVVQNTVDALQLRRLSFLPTIQHLWLQKCPATPAAATALFNSLREFASAQTAPSSLVTIELLVAPGSPSPHSYCYLKPTYSRDCTDLARLLFEKFTSFRHLQVGDGALMRAEHSPAYPNAGLMGMQIPQSSLHYLSFRDLTLPLLNP